MSTSQVTQVKEASDIAQVIGERLTLQRAGSSVKALCPFHSEKSPSFFISEQFQRYKCFGCGESGDVFTFLEKYEGMTFSEALQYLAERASITLTNYKPSVEDDQRQRLLEILHISKEYYHFLLTKHELGEPAREYLKNRGLTAESIRLFQLGYAMPAWDGLLTYLIKKKKFSLTDIALTGLSVTGKTGRSYDRFRDRIMFPLTNHRGQVVGFSGRLMSSDAKEAKYINTPETQLYHKSEMLFGYSELYQEIRKKREVVVVEGEFDVISSAQAHVNNIVAIKGSALTQQHLQLLKRAADKVLFSLDMDSAGVTATQRAIALAQDHDLDMRVITLPGGKDPDELSRTNPAAWRDAVKSSISVYDFLIQAAAKQHNPKTAEGKRQMIDQLAPVIGTISHAVEQDVYVKRLAEVLEVREDLVRQDIDRFKVGKQLGRSTASPQATAKPKAPKPNTRQANLELYLLFLFFHSPEQLVMERLFQLQELKLVTPGIMALLKELLAAPRPLALMPAIKKVPPDQQQLVFEISSQPEYLEMIDELDHESEWKKTLTEVLQEQVKAEITHINQELEKLERLPAKTPDLEAQQTALLQEIVVLRQKLSAKTQIPA
jgi:DNA primase